VGVRLSRGHYLLVSFSSRDGNRSECVFVWEVVEVEGSLRRGRGVKSWLSSFDRDSVKRDEDGCFRHQRSDSRSVREGISFMSISKSELPSRWRRVLYLSTRIDWPDPVVASLFGRTKQLKSRRHTKSLLQLLVTHTLPLLRLSTFVIYPRQSWARRVHLAEIDTVPACNTRFLWRVVSKSTGEQLLERLMMRCRSGTFMWWIKV